MKKFFYSGLLFFVFFTHFGQKLAPIDPTDPTIFYPNVLAFDYDNSGNQINRRFIYVASGVYKNSGLKANDENKLLDTDIYEDIKYYPNPVISELFIKWKNQDENYVNHIELYSINGQLIKKFDNLTKSDEINIDFQGFMSGYYILNLIYSNGEIKNLKIIKKDN
jgi:hypothetical protein